MPVSFHDRVRLPDAAATQLLLDLCVKFGLCLPPAWNSRLSKNPPATIERFAQTVCRVEGLDPAAESDLCKTVRTYVAQVFERYRSQEADEL